MEAIPCQILHPQLAYATIQPPTRLRPHPAPPSLRALLPTHHVDIVLQRMPQRDV